MVLVMIVLVKAVELEESSVNKGSLNKRIYWLLNTKIVTKRCINESFAGCHMDKWWLKDASVKTLLVAN